MRDVDVNTSPSEVAEDWPAGAERPRAVDGSRSVEAITKHLAITDAMNRVLGEALHCPTEEKLGNVCLEVAERITQSRCGFVGELNENGLADIAVSNPGWGACSSLGPDGHRRPPSNLKVHGIFGRVLTSGKSLFTNEPSRHPNSIGVPARHPPIHAFLGVPLYHEGKVMGMIGVANREGGYTQEQQDALEALAPAIVEAFMRKRAEDALRRSEQHFQALAAATFEGIVISEEGKYVDVNHQFVQMLGYSREELIGKDIADHIPPEDRELVLRNQRDGRETRTEHVMVRKDGTRIIAEAHGRTLVYQNRKVRFTAIRDITRQRQEEEVLHRYELLAKQSRDIILFVDRDSGRILDGNAAAVEAYGYSQEELKGRTIHELRSPEMRALTEQQIEEADERGILFETTHQRQDGTRFPVEVSSRGATIRGRRTLVSVIRDISARKAAEEALRESEHRLRAMGDNLPDSAVYEYVCEPDGKVRFLYFGAGLERLTGIRAEDVLSDTGALYRQILPEFLPQLMEAEVRSARDLSDFHMDVPIRRPDGQVRWMRLHSRPRRLHNGRVVWDGVQTDVTERKHAEEALRSSEERYRELFQAMQESLFVAEVITDETGVPADWRYIDVNPQIERQMKLTHEQMVGRTYRQVARSPDPAWIALVGRVGLSGEPATQEMFAPTIGRWVIVNAYSPRPRQVAVLFTDITERKRAAETLTQLNRTLRALSKSSQAMVRATEERQYVEEVCRNVVHDCGHLMAWVGYARQDEQKTVEVFSHAGFEEGYLQTAQISWADTDRGRGPTGTAIREGRPSICHNMLTDARFGPWRSEALRRGYRSSIALPLIAEGGCFGAMTIYSDKAAPFSDREVTLLRELADDLAHGITSIRLREAHGEAMEFVRDSEQQFRAFFQTPAVGTAQMGTDGRFTQVNDKFCDITGYNRDELLAMGPMNLTHPADRSRDSELLAAYLCGEIGTYEAEKRYIRKDGRVIWVQITAGLIRDAEGRPWRSAGVIQDITQRKEAQALIERHNAELEKRTRQLEVAKAEAEHANQVKNHFLAVLSHELRNPLNPVLASASMLREDDRFDAQTRELLEIICRNAELEARLIDDLLDVTRIEKGKLELDRQRVAIGGIIRRAAEVCMPDIRAKQLEFAIEIADERCIVHADQARLLQVFWNLLKNAIKFTPTGGRVSVSCCRDGDGHVVADVIDNGEGIEPDVLGRIFNAFEQGGRHTTRQFGGLGLGLAISKALVDLHGGTLGAYSEGKGKGARFTLRLPVLSRADSPAALTTADVPAARSPVNPMRVLLVEDHDDTARIMNRLLTSQGHRVEVAGDVATGLALVTSRPFDLLLSDLGLPDGTGLDLIRGMRNKGVNVPAIALSGYGQEQDLQQTREAGFAMHLVKPVTLAKLNDAIAKVTRRAECCQRHQNS